MIQIDEIFCSETTSAILCCYINGTAHLQIVRLPKLTNGFYDRVIFPGERLLFEAIPEAQLEIHTAKPANIIMSQKILCARLQVCEGMQPKRETCDREMLAEQSA
ncbi:MAG: DUF1830 domain-containing protein [Oscillatoria princeps RMCB-10]|jgi:hypothetical protein|nr:DUF1830 domain-containing protein [Oscillatoria princeps RMCB-10]